MTDKPPLHCDYCDQDVTSTAITHNVFSSQGMIPLLWVNGNTGHVHLHGAHLSDVSPYRVDIWTRRLIALHVRRQRHHLRYRLRNGNQ